MAIEPPILANAHAAADPSFQSNEMPYLRCLLGALVLG
jgi:hypothetical protein